MLLPLPRLHHAQRTGLRPQEALYTALRVWEKLEAEMEGLFR